MSKYTYSKFGVDIDTGNKFIENIKKTIKSDKKPDIIEISLQKYILI